MLLSIALMGGIFSVLTFIHFFVDWIFQSHAEAMVKHNNPKIRAKHCLIYTVGFVPFFLFCNFSWIEWIIALNILFWSHFCEDTYIPVMIWAKYIRKPPEMNPPADPIKGFIEFVNTPLGKILMIVIDQIIHILFLFPIAYIILRKLF
jgi:hypothetical protein